VGSLLLGLVLLGVILALVVLLKNRGSRPEPPMEAPALPPRAPRPLSTALEPALTMDAPTEEIPRGSVARPLPSGPTIIERIEPGEET